MFIYTAKIYVGAQEVQNNTSDDLEQLFIWMLTQVQGKTGDYHGHIINNSTNEIIRNFRKCHDE
ncbi:hypothetical protein B1207_01350 [Legionella quinlivanii]|uniref:Uncharacterized protein n=1 Tax=Legionella quinlivanii TaxID=45073 RepID=A0A364LNC0_9GAMM|nr:hypothetical protein [Legionella quinlivanii]RAP38557.1 hypothetical protein B1207_01350 [Legionella quinlivanii]